MAFNNRPFKSEMVKRVASVRTNILPGIERNGRVRLRINHVQSPVLVVLCLYVTVRSSKCRGGFMIHSLNRLVANRSQVGHLC